jgi:hypothetical protein
MSLQSNISERRLLEKGGSSMRDHFVIVLSIGLIGVSACVSLTGHAQSKSVHNVQLGPRPYFLVDDMQEGPLEQELERCGGGPFKTTDFSIGHRGACLPFSEHTRESYEAAARMGAGIVECDVTLSPGRSNAQAFSPTATTGSTFKPLMRRSHGKGTP